MIKQGFLRIVAGVLALGLGVMVATTPVSAIGEGGAPAGVNAAHGDNMPANLANGDTSIIRRGINLMLYGAGVLSVVMLIWGGVRYVVSSGKKDSVTAAKNTIIYAIIGLLISIFAYAIINFVLMTAIGGSGGPTQALCPRPQNRFRA